MRICFVHEEYPDETNFGGIATYQKIMAEYYASIGDEVTVIARGSKNINYYENNVHIYRVASKNNSKNFFSVINYRKKISKLLKKIQLNFDIIETPDWGANTIFFEKYRKVPIVVRLHTPLKIWLQYNKNNFGITKNFILKWENIMLNRADLVTSCSNLLKEKVLNECNLNKEIDVIPNPCNTIEFDKNACINTNDLIFVGSLEERKGVILLAKSLNIVFSKYTNSKIYFVGKDTKRNSKNISTKEYILSIVKRKFHKRLIFVDQVENKKVYDYLKLAKIAIIPSIFDNYPYVALESLSLGKYIVISNNIGLIGIVDKKSNYIFKSGDFKDLSNGILKLLSSKDYINVKNIKNVYAYCNKEKVCLLMKKIYLRAQDNFKKKKLFQKILKSKEITSIEKIEPGLANDVYKVISNRKEIIIKKYNHKYDFLLSKMLYKIYKRNKIKVIEPINNNIIKFDGNEYNIFKYLDDNITKKIDDAYLIRLLKVNRKVSLKANLIDKCDIYYDYLKNLSNCKINEERLIIKIYSTLREKRLFYDSYLNHGDISYNNIISHNGYNYLIDFDETIVTTELYDFAVIVIKFKTENYKLNIESIRKLINKLNLNYSRDDYIDSIRMYLCKILLEKFYLYEINKIDLYSKKQKEDFYKKYVNLIQNITKI